MSKALVVMAHGSRAAAANDEFRSQVEQLARRCPGFVAVVPCFLELASPSLNEAIQQLAHQPVEQVFVYPMFFNGGKHVARDIPAQVREARERYPELKIELLEYLGSTPDLADLMARHVGEQTAS
ncbi:sirohydrochlorin chelatase [Alloalcanivorax xenomutans]|jgi:sirohydrochlorin cobaltochelatase|uniref:CbiX/SirB N-terminal domain-containing protein n=1 Tax=Alloalcanivorax xenomutans TaxID=1094342 RepID=A0A9Q3W011_9GAMM|nr:CbiX/SirB N-terminal domain-containing protein [Alloalcanivorax xenomutans]ERS14199.1 sirohydrochlorin cobaltochelatase [Alcanivorax sp. PN-3]KYZ85422.1 sirohydrochlorin cobaltochelatase [Alcanivorax sp. KX64203]MBA4722293.1 CbiX/SirB N-terminal domain-containing protein [Alcanivorax sp.]ARB47370.1 sirohydrochlorin cobaltochelatase [Alloalcanivorax xenomutans]MCE7508190.1 CbiX/SirB N-terminal domain-containing protein [Alloalcanivorax xenomutans]